ncbi:hypothetical protein [Kibdelosporangium aridum]|uniref:Uncharacterized protein n=1 Tax=Kibdelosporangium aridum TaxID=2030 RepID=A0A1W2EYA6_KIBAR|nr:hypothetical protein [Kibdelosporangium aridum]SMD14697.1 hypothetical protein SAMN05661093_05099 [Kibdelosporangium aridum]
MSNAKSEDAISGQAAKSKEGGGISAENLRFPKEQRWMDGRQVFVRPESRASTTAKRDIIGTEEERDAVTEAHVISSLARRAMTVDEIEEEIKMFDELDEKNPLVQ